MAAGFGQRSQRLREGHGETAVGLELAGEMDGHTAMAAETSRPAGHTLPDRHQQHHGQHIREDGRDGHFASASLCS